MRYFFIGDKETSLGFRVAGVESKIVNNSETCSLALKMASENEDIGIILITNKAANLIRKQVDHHIFSVNSPLICEIPSIVGRSQNYRTLYEYANQVINLKL